MSTAKSHHKEPSELLGVLPSVPLLPWERRHSPCFQRASNIGIIPSVPKFFVPKSLTIVVLVLICAALPAMADPQDAIVIVLAKFPGSNVYEIGTGSFVDHSGLILTADHVVHHVGLTPPATTSSAMVPATAPTSITVYSAFLHTALNVDLTSPGTLVGGQISATQWLDAALIRVKLNPDQQNRIVPLDIAAGAPSMGDTMQAYGPSCPRSDPTCYVPSVVRTNLANDPSTARSYQVQAPITLGYSGGPLVNASNNIVAIDSWGDVVLGNQIFRASYLPAPYIVSFLMPLIPLRSPLSCSTAGSLPFLTAFDWAELSQSWTGNSSALNSPDQCTCCCQSLDKAKNVVLTKPLQSSCTPPFCAQKNIFGLTNGLNTLIAAGADTDRTAVVYGGLRDAIASSDLSGLSVEEKKRLYSNAGRAFAALADHTSDSVLSKTISIDALMNLQTGQLLQPSQRDYSTMSILFNKNDIPDSSLAASVLGSIVDSKMKVDASALGVDSSKLEHSVANGISALASKP